MNIKTAVGPVLALAVVGLMATGGTAAAGKADVNPVSGMLTKAQMQDGWIALFDGQTPFGWKIEGESKVADGALVLGGEKVTKAETTTWFGACKVRLEGDGLEKAKIRVGGKTLAAASRVLTTTVEGRSPQPVVIEVPEGQSVRVRKVLLKPEGMESIFNGKDLTGWKPVEGKKSIFTVTDKGEINIKDGGGDLQSEWQGDDFVLQLDAISNGKHLNSGVFYRALPGQYWQGYEVQIRNQWEGEDRTKPVDYGTGGIYNRHPTRKVVSTDGEWFTITLVTRGAHMATWVDGYQCTDFVDEKPDAPTARKGRYLGKGCISLQGHDPTTDLSFKNIRVADTK